MLLDYKQLEFIHQNLRNLLSFIEKETGIEFTITSIYRIGDNGVHGQLPVRGIDLRTRNKSIGEKVESLINDSWVYDANRPSMKCCLLHGEGLNLHLHLQVSDRTTELT